MNDEDLNVKKNGKGLNIILCLLIFFTSLSFIPIGSILIHDIKSQIQEYETVLNENKETLNKYYADNYKVYLNDIELNKEAYNSVLEHLENYDVLINQSDKTIRLKER